MLTLVLEVLLPLKINFTAAPNLWMGMKKNNSPSSSSLEPLLKPPLEENYKAEEDIDVQNERCKVLSGRVHSAIIYLRNLRKVLNTLQNCFVIEIRREAYMFLAFRCIQEERNMVQKLRLIHWPSQYQKENVLVFSVPMVLEKQPLYQCCLVISFVLFMFLWSSPKPNVLLNRESKKNVAIKGIS